MDNGGVWQWWRSWNHPQEEGVEVGMALSVAQEGFHLSVPVVVVSDATVIY